MAKWGQKSKLDVTILTGDRDSFQLVDKSIRVRIPHTTQGKTEVDDYTIEKIEEKYGLKPKELIEVKEKFGDDRKTKIVAAADDFEMEDLIKEEQTVIALTHFGYIKRMPVDTYKSQRRGGKGITGNSSDNIPGIPGVGEKTAINLVKQYKTIEGIYEHIGDFKGKLKEKIEQNEDMAYMSRTLGTIDTKVPIEVDLKQIKLEEWNKEEVLKIFKKLKFAKFIEKFLVK